MPTIRNPYGTPDVIYNRGGSNIQEITAPAGSLIPTTMPNKVGHFVVTATGNHTQSSGVELPSNADVGDMAYFYNLYGSSQFWIHAPSGENILGFDDIGALASSRGLYFLKYNSTSWAVGPR